MAKKRTISDVEKLIALWIEEAGRTLRRDRMPTEVRALSKSVGSWPDMVRDPAEAYGWDKATARSGPPSGDEIDRLTTVLGWLLEVPAEYRPILAAKMNGISFYKIARIDPKRRSHEAVRRAYWAGIHYIFRHVWEENTKFCEKGLSRLSKTS